MRRAIYWSAVILCAVATRAGVGQPASQPDTIRAGPERELRAPSVSGRALISTTKKKLSWGENFDIEVRFESIGGFAEFFNPFFNELTVQPAEIALFDANDKYLGDLLGNKTGSFRPPSSGEWVWIPNGSFVGTKIHLSAFVVTPVFDPADPLPPGRYRLQAVYHSRFVSQPVKFDPKAAKDPFDHWYATYRDRDLFRSNVIEIELAAQAAGDPVPSDKPGPGPARR